MTNFTTQLISAAFQIALFLAIPFIWWLVRGRKQRGFFGWLGWHQAKITQPGKLALIMIITLVAFAALGMIFIEGVGEASPSPLTGLGFNGIAAGLVYAIAQTAFAEESLFRGFILKRVAGRYGFWAGNVVQAVCFGLAHGVPLALLGGAPLFSIGSALYSGTLGLIMGWLNERMAGGSLLPSWIMHALANLFSAYLTLFILG